MKEMWGSRELREGLQEDPKDTLIGFGISTGIISALGVPVFVATAPPALVVRNGRKLKRGLSNLKQRLLGNGEEGSGSGS
jgi:hypothetical protein